MTDIEQISHVITAVNSAWLQADTAALALYFEDDVAVALPGSLERVRGKAQCVESYAAFTAHAVVSEFTTDAAQVDLVGSDTAVATTAFRIAYEMHGELHREEGQDLMVLHRHGGAWRVAWRTVIATEAA